MKLMIASDIHGSSYYTKKLLELFEKENADNLVLMGDFLYHGPRNPFPQDYNPILVSQLLNNYKDKIIAVKGNCDADIDLELLQFEILPTKTIAFNNRTIYLTHGDKINLDNPPQLNKNDILINGHFHKQQYLLTDTFIYLNPGSVSLPKDDNRGYIIIDDTSITFKDLDSKITLIKDL